MQNQADSHESLMQFLYLTPIGLAQTALDGTVEMINPMAAQLLMPLSPDGGLDNLFDTLDTVAPQLRAQTASFTAPSGVVCEAVRLFDVPDAAQQTKGQGRQVLSVSILKLDPGRLMVVLNDVTQEVRLEQTRLARRLDDAARIDLLTKMPNRSAVLDQLGLVLAARDSDGEAPAGFALIFINCNRFRHVNDSLGRAVGDELLALMAERLRSTLRLNDAAGRDRLHAPIAARIGGDEFAVVLQDLPRPDDVHAVAHRIVDTLSPPYGIGSRQVSCSISIGVLLGAQLPESAEAALQDAGTAMNRARQSGGSTRYTVFEPWMREEAARRAGLEAELRGGLENGQFFVVYQPVVGLQQARDVDCSAGVEALVRWRHPVRGLVSPLEFIAAAEECGFIGPLGAFVLAEACRAFVAWQRELGDIAPRLLAVNLSRAQLTDAGFVDAVRDILASTGMAAARLQLEVTESLAAQDESVQVRLHELKSLGLTLALDDFGTGYSSLASLHLLPVDTVKIDRSFVSQSDTSAHHRVLVEATVRVAESLGMGTVAEGIETQAQADTVCALGCLKGQGFLFGRPMEADALVRWLVERNASEAKQPCSEHAPLPA